MRMLLYMIAIWLLYGGGTSLMVCFTGHFGTRERPLGLIVAALIQLALGVYLFWLAWQYRKKPEPFGRTHLFVIGIVLLLLGLGGTVGGLAGVPEYLSGRSCSMALIGVYVLPLTLPAIYIGVRMLIAARRHGAGPPTPSSA